jgi:hypothetical protein
MKCPVSFVLLAAAAMLLWAPSATLAAKVKPKVYSKEAVGYALEQCLLDDNHKEAFAATRWACCSKETGVCVICPNEIGGDCTIVEWTAKPFSGPRVISPNSNNKVAPN